MILVVGQEAGMDWNGKIPGFEMDVGEMNLQSEAFDCYSEPIVVGLTDRFHCIELRKPAVIDVIEFAVHAFSPSGFVEQHRSKPSSRHDQWEALDRPDCSEAAGSAKACVVQRKSPLQCSKDKNERHDQLRSAGLAPLFRLP
jgi:hypothetical protein